MPNYTEIKWNAQGDACILKKYSMRTEAAAQLEIVDPHLTYTLQENSFFLQTS